ncbi:PREDICTED: transcription factor TGA4-like [Camelina sativa]|uniref:Transcription factor TGA4-like n=1 Tax=Camelina sativa TaxID=90675 RepID=A0ABM0Z6H6_CAMSA|nr:PREDICTED: transcription factor TGA4-like [Camelina sativa]
MPIISSSETFTSFFNDWLLRHRQLIQQLAHFDDETISVTPEEEESLVTQFLSHCLQYYQEKSAAVSVAGDDIYDFFSPPWLSSCEKLILWIGGFKPGMVFKLITTSVNDLTSHQKDQLESIRLETKRRERALMGRFAHLQQSVGDPLLMVPFKRIGALRLGEREQSEMEEAMEVLKREMKEAMKNADQLRCVTVRKVVEVLNPGQAIKLLRAAGEFYLKLRDLGVQIETVL